MAGTNPNQHLLLEPVNVKPNVLLWETMNMSLAEEDSEGGHNNSNSNNEGPDGRIRLQYNSVNVDDAVRYRHNTNNYHLGPGWYALMGGFPCRIISTGFTPGGKHGHYKYFIRGVSLLDGKTIHEDYLRDCDDVTVPAIIETKDNQVLPLKKKHGQQPVVMSWSDEDYIPENGYPGYFLFTHTSAKWDDDGDDNEQCSRGSTVKTVWVLPKLYSPLLRLLRKKRDALERNITAYLAFLHGAKQRLENHQGSSPCTMLGEVNLPHVFDLIFDMVCGPQAERYNPRCRRVYYPGRTRGWTPLKNLTICFTGALHSQTRAQASEAAIAAGARVVEKVTYWVDILVCGADGDGVGTGQQEMQIWTEKEFLGALRLDKEGAHS